VAEAIGCAGSSAGGKPTGPSAGGKLAGPGIGPGIMAAAGGVGKTGRKPAAGSAGWKWITSSLKCNVSTPLHPAHATWKSTILGRQAAVWK